MRHAGLTSIGAEKDMVAERGMSDSTKDQARVILANYFAVQRVVLGATRDVEALRAAGWSMERQIHLVRLLADGCHNLPEIAAGLWEGYQPVSPARLAEALAGECRWLYDLATVEGGLCYPALWLRDAEYYRVWRRFWESVAMPLELPAVCGTAWEEVETQEQALHRIRLEAEGRALVRYPGFWARLVGLSAPMLPWTIDATEYARRGDARREIQ